MPVFTKGGVAVLFVHIPKCAGTSISHAFRQAGYERHFFDIGVQNKSLFYVRSCSPQHYHREILEKVFDISKFNLVFHVVRNPVSRVLSEYVMRNKGISDYIRPSFSSWFKRIVDRYDSNPFILDNHIRPQVDFLISSGETFRYEDGLKSMFEHLSGKLSCSGLKSIGGNIMLTHRSPGQLSPVDVDLTDDDLHLIKEFYAEDFKILGYNQDVSQL